MDDNNKSDDQIISQSDPIQSGSDDQQKSDPASLDSGSEDSKVTEETVPKLTSEEATETETTEVVESTPTIEEPTTAESETSEQVAEATQPISELTESTESAEQPEADATSPDQIAGEPADTTTPAKNDNPNARWYVVHTYSGHENKVAATLKQRVESEHLQEKILDVLVPTQDKIEIKGGKKATVKEKIFPGYILVKMVLEDTSWLAVRTTQGVTSFVGMGNKPTPISEAEVQTIVRFTKEEAPTYKQVFSMDDTVKIVDGPFAEFIGKVDNVDEERGKVKVLVSIFGRETPVELDFLQVQKI